MTVLHLDFETFAHRDLRKVGAYEYVACTQFEPTVLAWAFDDEPVQSMTWPNLNELPSEIIDHIMSGGPVHAWNASFEHIILTEHFGWPVGFEQMVCTMQRALANGLPAALGDAGPAMGLPIIKDTAARSLMLRMGKPKKDGSLWHQTDPAKLAALQAYCETDVAAERELGRHLPGLSAFERKVSLIDARSNAMGVQVDDAAVAVLASAREHVRRLQKNEVVTLTGGAITRIESETAGLLAWLKAQGLDVRSVDKEAIAGALKTPGLRDDVRQVLQLRQASARSSLGKLDRMLLVQGSDGRARGLLQYYGAGRTGRWAGRLIQIQNLPRNVDGIDPQAVLEVAKLDPAGLGLFWDPLEALTTCLRGCLTAAPGKLLAMIDLSQIEARVLAWLADQEDVLSVFRSGADVYTYAAKQLGSTNRQLGKVVTLACGYGMGPGRFQETALGYGVTLTDMEAIAAVQGWRNANQKIVKFWYALENVARDCIQVPGKIVTVGKVRLRVRDGKLLIEKPDKGVLVYRNPRIESGDVMFDGVGQTNKKWGTQYTYGGKLAENLTQAVARDVMADAMVRIEEAVKAIPVMSVHDELVYEVGETGSGLSAQLLQERVNKGPAWGAGLPIASKLHVGFRYGK